MPPQSPLKKSVIGSQKVTIAAAAPTTAATTRPMGLASSAAFHSQVAAVTAVRPITKVPSPATTPPIKRPIQGKRSISAPAHLTTEARGLTTELIAGSSVPANVVPTMRRLLVSTVS